MKYAEAAGSPAQLQSLYTFS